MNAVFRVCSIHDGCVPFAPTENTSAIFLMFTTVFLLHRLGLLLSLRYHRLYQRRRSTKKVGAIYPMVLTLFLSFHSKLLQWRRMGCSSSLSTDSFGKDLLFLLLSRFTSHNQLLINPYTITTSTSPLKPIKTNEWVFKLTITRCNKKIVSKRSGTPNAKSSFKVKFFIFKPKKKFEFFICEEVTHVRGDTP